MKIKAKSPALVLSIHEQYKKHGVQVFYEKLGENYINPHEEQIHKNLSLGLQKWSLDLTHVLDLCAGSGEITAYLLNNKICGLITGVDPYTDKAYEKRTGQKARTDDFQKIAQGSLLQDKFSLVVCSFALHLAPKSLLASVCLNLSQVSPSLLILSPHKKPDILPQYGWQLQDEFVHNRVRTRLYKSLIYQKPL